MKTVLIQTKEKLVSYGTEKDDFDFFSELKCRISEIGVVDQNYILISRSINDSDYLKKFAIAEFGYTRIIGMTFRNVWFPFCDDNTIMIIPESILKQP